MRHQYYLTELDRYESLIGQNYFHSRQVVLTVGDQHNSTPVSYHYALTRAQHYMSEVRDGQKYVWLEVK